MSYPELIYKYRPIEKHDDLKNDYYLDALFNQYAIFSSRANFNDLFDSKVNLIKPTPKEIKELSRKIPKNRRNELLKNISKGCFTPEGNESIEKLKLHFNKKVDSYAFMSLSSRPDSNLMWSHYGASHRGFCIEYKTEFLKARKVTYVADIPSLKMLDLYYSYYGLLLDDTLGVKILDALHCKLNEWGYESEYRYMASSNTAIISDGGMFKKINYNANFVSSVIFGCRMEQYVKDFIIGNMPVGTIFKQAIIGVSTIEIVDYNK